MKRGRVIRAFTLTELLVVLAVVVLLASLGSGALASARRGGEEVGAAATMQRLGAAILASTGDRDGVLPGPLWPGQVPLYDAGRSGRLVVELAPYLGLGGTGGTRVVDWFVPPAAARLRPKGVVPGDQRVFVMNMKVPTLEGVVNPWGSLAAGGGGPMPLTRSPELTRTWAFSDADQEHPHVRTAAWRTAAAERPVHGNGRMAWFLDGRVQKLGLDAFADPPVTAAR
jgi:prepilin-type N-terminal cleavage/methylation domain-containing protein/prepilin-type processing-associated H-X9-DG protein